LLKKESWFSAAKKKAAFQVSRIVNGSAQTVTVSNYDVMGYDQANMAGGPLGIYPQCMVHGQMAYDYDRKAWFFKGVQLAYQHENRGLADKLTGTIAYDQKQNTYTFDVRLNEPAVSEASAFNTTTQDESSFFATDPKLVALTGTMKYKDTVAGDVVTASHVDIDLVGNQMDKIQTMNLFKLIILTAIIPMNSE
jgi:hypothetical protein